MPEINIRLQLPHVDPDSLVIDRTGPDAAAARAAEAAEELEKARRGLAAAELELELLPAAITAGRAAPADWDTAVRARELATMAIPAAERALADARAAVTRAESEAKAELRRRVLEKLDALAAAAKELTPALLRIRDMEIGLVQTLEPASVASGRISWPTSNLASVRANFAIASAAATAAPAEPEPEQEFSPESGETAPPQRSQDDIIRERRRALGLDTIDQIEREARARRGSYGW